MSMLNGILIATAIVGGTGLFISAFLGIAESVFHVHMDERETAILEALPGANCGGCGYPGCAGAASAVIKGEAPATVCPVGGEAVADKICKIMGIEHVAMERKVAFVKCGGTSEKSKPRYEYNGITDCRMAAVMPLGGPKGCAYGCLGFGTCVDACPFDAIHIKDGVAVVDKEKCTACGNCVAACPKGLIELVPYSQSTFVQCSSKDRGKIVTQVCESGCIGCKICEKKCPNGAIKVTDFLARIDPQKCTNCGICVSVCPKKAIITTDIQQ